MAKKILVIEDESSIRKALVEKLQREGFDVLLAYDGVQGLEQANLHHPDLILLDIIMPKMDGMTMLRNLRMYDDEYGKTVPVIILTNLSSDDDNRNKDVAELSPAFYLVKTDWTLDDVVGKIRERLGA